MVLLMTAYYHPLRMVLINNDGNIDGFYCLAKNDKSANRFYEFPFGKVIDKFIAEDIDLSTIDEIVILGKPLVYFESFIERSLVPPGFQKAFCFAKGTSHYLKKILRIKRDIKEALRRTPRFLFFSTVEAYLKGAQVLNWGRELLLWNHCSELEVPILIDYRASRIKYLHQIRGDYKRYVQAKTVESKRNIFFKIVEKLNLQKAVIVTPEENILSVDDQLCLTYFSDNLLIALVGLYALYHSSVKGSDSVICFQSKLCSILGQDMLGKLHENQPFTFDKDKFYHNGLKYKFI